MQNASTQQKNIVKTARGILKCLSGGDSVGLLSLVLKPEQQIALSVVRPIFDAVKAFTEDENKKNRYIAMQAVAPFVPFSALKKVGFTKKSRNVHEYAVEYYGKNQELRYEKVETRGRKSKVKDPVINKVRVHTMQSTLRDCK